jgi:hypothetical protein
MLDTVRSSAQFFLALHPSMNFHKDMNNSPANLVKQVDGQVSRILRQTDMREIGEKARKALAELAQDLRDAKMYTRDYELSEMREEQLDNAKKAKKWLDKARAAILRASEFNVFNAVDVAHLTAQIDQAKADLK